MSRGVHLLLATEEGRAARSNYLFKAVSTLYIVSRWETGGLIMEVVAASEERK